MFINLHAHNPTPISKTDEAVALMRGWHLDMGTPEHAAAARGEITEEEANLPWSGPDGRITVMDRMGQDLQVVSLPSHYGMYWADAAWATNYAQQVNEYNAQYCSAYPDRLFFWAHTPLQDGAAAAKVLHHAVTELGAKGLATGGDNFGGIGSGDDSLSPVWEVACDLDVPVWVHGYNQSVNWADPSIEPWGTTSVVGMCHDESLMFWNLVNSGALDRFPNLKVVITHGGGFTPFQLGRFEGCNALLPDAKNEKPLESYLHTNFWFDVLVENPIMRKAVVDVIGADRLVYGDNFMGSDGIRTDLAAELDLPASDYDKITNTNAAKLLKLA